MSQKRKVYSPKLRSQVALAAVRGDKTIHEVAQRYGVSPQMVIKMKSRLLDRIEELFQDGRTTKKKSGSGPEMSGFPPRRIADGRGGMREPAAPCPLGEWRGEAG